MSSIIDRINIISRLLKYVYGDYWLKWQWVIIFKTIIPFIFWGMLYLWYRSIRNVFMALKFGFLELEPWTFIVEASHFNWIILIVLVTSFVCEALTSGYEVLTRKRMLNGLASEAERLFEIKEKVGLWKTMRMSLLKTISKHSLTHAFTIFRYITILWIPIAILFLFSFILGSVIHLEILSWTSTNLDFTIYGWRIAPSSFVETHKDYLFHPYMAIIYVIPFFLLMAGIETVGSHLEKRPRKTPLHGILTSVITTDILHRIARACWMTLRCLFIEDVRQVSQEVIILSPRDLHTAIAKTIGRDQEHCVITIHMGLIEELEEGERKELMTFLREELLPEILKKGKLGEITMTVMTKQSKKISEALKKVRAHMFFVLVKEGCKFIAFGQRVFGLSVKYSIWCEDPFMKDSIIKLVGKEAE